MYNNYSIRNFIIVSFISILISRLVPHPPNFTSAIAVGFYIPALFGYRYILIALTAFILSDLIIGGHNLLLFTWGSIILIGLLSKYFNSAYLRILGITASCLVFYFVSNFGVWLLGSTYTNDFSGLVLCYFMGLPFLQNSLISSLVVSALIEFIISMNFAKNYIAKINSAS
jgi:hypothetical protein